MGIEVSKGAEFRLRDADFWFSLEDGTIQYFRYEGYSLVSRIFTAEGNQIGEGSVFIKKLPNEFVFSTVFVHRLADGNFLIRHDRYDPDASVLVNHHNLYDPNGTLIHAGVAP